jgi:hypothetical protein
LHICCHLSSTWILEREQTILLCHEPLVIQKASGLVQEIETGDWYDSDPIREQKEPLDLVKAVPFYT